MTTEERVRFQETTIKRDAQGYIILECKVEKIFHCLPAITEENISLLGPITQKIRQSYGQNKCLPHVLNF